MKTMKIAASIAVLSGSLLAMGCAVSEQVYLQDATVTAPAGSLPVRLANNAQPGRLTVSPSISFGAKSSADARVPGHSQVDATGHYAVDTIVGSNGYLGFRPGSNPYDFKGTNLHWTTPAINAMLSVDYTLSKTVALEGGVCYASGNGTDLWGGHVGLGLMSEGEVFGMRISGGFQWTPTYYDVSTVVETQFSSPFISGNPIQSAFYRDQGSGSPFGWYAGMTLNTRVDGWVVQPFANVTLSKENFFSFKPANTIVFGSHWLEPEKESTTTAEASAVLVIISPGLSFSVGPTQTILVGARWALVPDMVNQDGSSMPSRGWLTPFVQVDIGL